MRWWAPALVGLWALLPGGARGDRIDQLLQFKTLKEFFEATNGPAWKNNSGWLDGPPCGKDWRLPGNTPWHGLICNMENAVTSINLINHGLKGTIPESFFTGLQGIERINIGQNSLAGTIPRTICQAPWLLTFAAQLNRGLTGRLPDCVTTIPFLEELILEMTSVSGTIPISPFPKIKVLILSNSKFSGTIPDIWSAMADLRVLILNGCSGVGSNANCKLHGTIPASMYTLPNLFLWSLQQNNLNGTISDLQNMKKLREIHMNDNHLTGEIPPSFYTQFSKPVHKENATRGMAHFENNKLTGRLLRKLEHLQFIKEIGLMNNHFTGYPPKCLYDYSQKDSLDKWGEHWELFPQPKEALSKIPWLPGIPAWAVKFGARSKPFQVSHVVPSIMEAPIIYPNGSYYGPSIFIIGSGFVELVDELRCGFFRPEIKVKLGDPCNGIPPGSPDGLPDCVSTKAKLWNHTHIQCKVVNLPGMLGAVTTVVLFEGDDLNEVRNTTHVISVPKTLLMYEPAPIIRAISPRSGRAQGCTSVTFSGKSFVDTKHWACWFNDTRVDGVFQTNSTVLCPSPPLWDPELLGAKLSLRLSPMNGTSFAVLAPGVFPSDITFSYVQYCDLQPYNPLMHMPPCDCGLCPCSSFGTCVLNASMIPKPGDTDEFVLPVTSDVQDDEVLHFPMCYCLVGFTGGNCSECARGYYGDTCRKCDCDRGTCVDGRSHDGHCRCEAWWSGQRCDYYFKPLLTQILAFGAGVALVGLVGYLRLRPGTPAPERAPLLRPEAPSELYTPAPS